MHESWLRDLPLNWAVDCLLKDNDNNTVSRISIHKVDEGC